MQYNFSKYITNALYLCYTVDVSVIDNLVIILHEAFYPAMISE